MNLNTLFAWLSAYPTNIAIIPLSFLISPSISFHYPFMIFLLVLLSSFDFISMFSILINVFAHSHQ